MSQNDHRDPGHGPQTPDHSGEQMLERNIAQLLTRAHQPPTMNPAARARVLENLERRVTRRRETPAANSGPWPWAWPAGAALASVACVLAIWWLSAPSGLTRSSRQFTPRTIVTDVRPGATILADGTELVSNRGTRLTVTGPRAIRIESGDVLLDVAKATTPFVVEAPHGRIVVLGTRFVVNARADRTLASVVRGRVQIENPRGQARLSAGEQGVLRRDAEPRRRRAPRLSHLVGWAQDARRTGHADDPLGQPIRSGALIARNPGWPEHDYPLPMRELVVDVHVEDRVARVAIDQTFFNPQDWQLEGVYRFPLPPGAAISRLAMYVAGQRMEAAIVDRQRGREIYESIVHRRRDPALLEWMAGNQFKVRIFPLPARQEKRIVLSYTQSLHRLYDDYRLAVPLPALETPVDRVRYRVRLAACVRCEVTSTSHEITSTRDGDDIVVSFERTGHRIGDDLLLTIREPDSGPLVAAFEGKDGADAHNADASYVMVRATPEIAGELPGVPATPRATPRRWVILHDTSASRQPLERKAQRYFIERLLSEIDETDQVNLIAFDATTRTWSPSFVTVGALDRDSLASFLAEQSVDGVGHTDLEGALRAAVTLLDGAPEPHILYVGDGIVTGGTRDQAALEQLVAGRATFVAATVGDTVDLHRLRALTTATGGMLTTTRPGDDLAWRAFDLVAALDTPRATRVRARLLDAAGEPLPDTIAYASSPSSSPSSSSGTSLADGEEMIVIARGVPGAPLPAALDLEGVVAGRPWHQRIDLSSASRPSAGRSDRNARYLPRLWAQQRIDQLLTRSGGERDDRDRQEIAGLGKKHFLMTPYTSLLVLENDAMYTQHRVKRDRTPAWAPYRLPDRIEVVREPRGQAGSRVHTGHRLAPGTVLVRTPEPILQRRSTSHGHDSHRHWNPEHARWSGILAIRGGGGVASGGFWGGLPDGPMTGLLDGEASVRRDTEESDDSQDIAGASVTVDSTTRSSNPTWSSNKALAISGIRGRGSSGGGGWGSGYGVGAGQGRGPALAGRLGTLGYFGRGDLGWLGHGIGYGVRALASLYPVALHDHSDPRLDDLSDFVPGLFALPIDHHIRTLQRQDSVTGRISQQARELLERARAGQGAATYRGPGGQTLAITRDGQLVVERILASGLGERVTYDGAELVHRYPELALATRRRVPGLAVVVFEHLAPFWLPAAEDLARWYHVERSGARTLTLRPATGQSAAGADGDTDRDQHIEIVLDDALRPLEIRAVHHAGTTVQRRFEYTEDSIVMVIPAAIDAALEPAIEPETPGSGATPGPRSTRERRITLVRVPDRDRDTGTGLLPAITGAYTTVDLPLRQPTYWTTAIATLSPDSADRRQAHIQLLASQAALGQTSPLWQTLLALREQVGNLAPGELVLASRAARAVTRRKDLSAALAGVEHPVAAYLRASHDSARRPDPAAFDPLVSDAERAGQPSLIATLGRYRGALAAITYRGIPRKAKERAVQFMARHPDTVLAYILAYQYNAYFQWQSPKNAASLWDALARGPWRSVARFEAARVFASSGAYDEAARRFEQIFLDPAHHADGTNGADDDDHGDQPRPDGLVHAAFINSSRGQAGWRALWIPWRDRALASGDPGRIADVLHAAVATGQRSDIDRAVARATELEIRDPDQALALAHALVAAGHRQAALTVLEPLIRDGQSDDQSDDASDDLTARDDASALQEAHDLAGQIASDMGQHERAARHYQRAMDLEDGAGAPVELATLRHEYQRLITLWSKVTQVRAGAERERGLRAALRAAARWRAVDPGNPEIDRLAATLLYAVDRPRDAWRHLSTAIERAPMEGESYRVVADTLEQQGQLQPAQELWRQAAEVDPTNPTWLLRRAQVLVSLGEHADASALLRTIERGRWHERFDRVTEQARRLAARLP